MALFSNADACYSLNGQLPDDPRRGWWKWGNNLMYYKCLQLARWKVGVRSSVVGGRFSLTSAQLPTCGRLRIFLHILFLFVSEIPLLLNGGKFTNISLSESSQQWWDDRQREGKSAHLHSSTLQRVRDVLNLDIDQIIMPTALVWTLSWKTN